MKGIILAGGSGTRLYPITRGLSKQLMPIYDKPMIYYPLCTLMQAGIREILIITTPNDHQAFQYLLGDGKSLGIELTYKIQEKPRGLADAYIVGADFIADSDVAMILGDNLFYGTQIDEILKNIQKYGIDGALIFGYRVSDPKRYGVIEFDNSMNVLSIEEKPENPKSNYAKVGIYFSDSEVVEIAKNLRPSERGEIEVTHAMVEYLNRGKLKAILLEPGAAWLDTGTVDSMMAASQFVQVIEKRQGIKIGCIEQIAYQMGYIKSNQLELLAKEQLKSGYGEYLLRLI